MSVTRSVGCLVLRHAPPVFRPHRHGTITLGAHQLNIVCSLQLGNRRFSSQGWIMPEGYDTGITIYNTGVKEKVPLKTLQPGLLTWYSCGPTVYDSAHIGHALSFVKFDIIRRILSKMFDLNVVMVLGVTDIDDKIIKRAQELGVGFREVTEYYEEEFFRDMDKIRVMRPTIVTRVTEHIPHIIDFVQRILEKKLAYSVSDGSVYFDTEAYGKYGKLATLPKITDLHSTNLKKSVRDFALWKGAKPGEPFWDSPWGQGRPGWHIECSAMASHVLGTQIDLHSGGIDLLFPHHENEEAQCCAYHSCDQWCNYWIHAGHLHAKGDEKMSKSLYNTISVSELLDQHSVNSFRLFCLLSHYRTKVDYTPTSMAQAKAHLRRIRSFLQDAYAYINGQLICGPLDEVGLKKKLAETRIKVKKSLADDLDTVRAFDAVLELVALGNKELQSKPTNVSIARSAGTMVSICSYIHYLMEDVFSITFPSVHDAANLSLEAGGRLANVMNSVVTLRHQVRSYALLQDKVSKNEELSSAQKKVIRKERAPLLDYCDNFREDLLRKGLQIKDHSGKSSWSVVEASSGDDKFKKNGN